MMISKKFAALGVLLVAPLLSITTAYASNQVSTTHEFDFVDGSTSGARCLTGEKVYLLNGSHTVSAGAYCTDASGNYIDRAIKRVDLKMTILVDGREQTTPWIKSPAYPTLATFPKMDFGTSQ